MKSQVSPDRNTLSTYRVRPAEKATMSLKLKLSACASLFALCMCSVAPAQTNPNQLAMDHPGWVQVPGELIRPDCVHEIPNGANVEIANGQITGDVTLNGIVIAHYNTCPEDAISTRRQERTENLDQPRSGNGWVEQAQWDDVNHNVDSLESSWIVPTKPSQDGSVLYLFNGIEPSSQNYILEPTLQYGFNGYFGGNYWTIASWLVGTAGVFYSSPETVYPGNRLSGYTELTHASGGILYYEVVLEDTTTRAYTVLEVQSSGLRWSWAYGAVLEAYHITSCAQFPPDHEDAFSDIDVYQGPPGYVLTHPEWQGVIDGYGGPSCGFAVDIKFESNVALHY